MNLNAPTITSLDPQVWGKGTWEFLDTVVVTYPRDNPDQEHRDAVINLLEGLRWLLPCPECRAHYNTFLDAHPMGDIVGSRSSLLRFYFGLRKEIARRTGRLFRMRNEQELWNHITGNLGVWKSAPARTAAAPSPPPVKPLPQSLRTARRGCNCAR